MSDQKIVTLFKNGQRSKAFAALYNIYIPYVVLYGKTNKNNFQSKNYTI